MLEFTFANHYAMRALKAIGKKDGIRLAVIIAVALALRCAMLSKESLWLDELAAWSFASGSLAGALHSEATNPPLYYLVLHFWIGWFGVSEAALRGLSVIPGVLSVWLVYRLARRLLSREIALLAAAYQAVSPFQVFYSQEARCFPLLLCLLLWATLLLWNALEAPDGRTRFRYYAGYAVICAAALYTHFIAVFFLAAHGVFVLARRPRQTFMAAASMCGSLILFAPWLLVLLQAAAGGGQIRRLLVLKLPQAYFSFLFGNSLIPLDEYAVQHIGETLRSNWWEIAAAIAGVAILSGFRAARLETVGGPHAVRSGDGGGSGPAGISGFVQNHALR